MKDIILELKSISKHYEGVTALSNVDISIAQGEIHCLVGENGSGKSTLIKIASGFRKPDSGDIFLNGKLYKNLHVLDSIREGIQVIYQDLSLYPNLTVADNIALNQLIEKNNKFINSKIIKNIAIEAINEIKVKLDLNLSVESLSIGDKQLVAICRALTQKARLIIMDEPTVALTRNEIELLFKVIKDLQQKGIATLFIGHKISEVFEISEKVTILRDGKKVGEFPTRELDHQKLVFYMTGKKIEGEKYYYEKIKNTNPILEVKDLNKKNNFKNISFKLFPGEILGITGLLGSGRTELALSIFGLNRPDSGIVTVLGKKLNLNSVREALRSGISYLPEDRLSEGLFIKKPIDINIIVTHVKNFLNKLKLINNNAIKKEVQTLIKDLSIKSNSARNEVQSLSGGNQQKVALAKWIATEPKIFILDSPTVGVDIASKYNIYKIIRNLAEQRNMAIIWISDEISEVLENCNRILLMRNGEIIDEIENIDITGDEIFSRISAKKGSINKNIDSKVVENV